MSYCIGCGATLAPDSLFCHRCGRPLQVATAVTTNVPVQVATALNTAVPVQITKVHIRFEPGMDAVKFKNSFGHETNTIDGSRIARRWFFAFQMADARGLLTAHTGDLLLKVDFMQGYLGRSAYGADEYNSIQQNHVKRHTAVSISSFNEELWWCYSDPAPVVIDRNHSVFCIIELTFAPTGNKKLGMHDSISVSPTD